LEAEEKVKQLEAQVGEAQARASQAEAALGAAQRKWELERALAASGVIDAEAAAILAANGAGNGAGGARERAFDAGAVVAELKRKRPYLFGASAAPVRTSAMSGAVAPQGPDTLSRAAEEARASGDLGTLLKYLRMRRAS
jgi:multidrug resistance efflux pump